MTAAMEENQYEVGGLDAMCVSCAGRSFRRSRLRLKDTWVLLSLRYPVRCLSCNKRQTVPLSLARCAVSSKVKRSRELSADSDQQERPSTIGGTSSWSMPVRKPMAMPELEGVTLKHTTTFSRIDENPEQ